MARKLRIKYPGAIWHQPPPGYGPTSVMKRGGRREAIFKDDGEAWDGRGGGKFSR